MRFGYSRVSTGDQSLDIQNEDLTKAGCERILAEKITGTSMNERAELKTLLTILRAGDEVWITRLDRLARSVHDTLVIVDRINKAGATLHSIHENIETKSPAGKMLMTMLAAFAQYETEIRRARQMEGIAKARGARRYVGKRPEYDRTVIWKCYTMGKMTPKAIADRLGAHTSTIRRAIEILKKEQTLGLIK